MKATALDVPPPGAGFVTVMDKVPDCCRSDAGTVAVKDVCELNTVASAIRLAFTCELPVKPVPVNWIITSTGAVSTGVLLGLTAVSPGTGLEIANNPPPLADPPPGGVFVTPMVTFPERRKNVSGIVPVTRVGDDSCVGIGVPCTVICDVLLKFVPSTVIAIAGDPAFAPAGVNPDTVGATFRIFTLKLAEPPAFEIKPFNVAGF